MVESSQVQIRVGAFFLYYKKIVIFVSFLFLQGSSIERQKAKKYIICYFRNDKIFVLVFHIVVDYMYMLS